VSIRSAFDDPLYRSAYSLMSSTIATGALGVVFWIVAARTYPEDVIGRDGILISTMLTVASVGQLNMSNAILRFLPGAGPAGTRMMLRIYGVAMAGSLTLASGFVLVAPLVAEDLRFLSENWTLPVAYVVAVMLWSVFILQDAGLTAVRRAPWVALENATFAALKIAALPLLVGAAALAGHTVFAAWVIPVVLIVPAVNYLLFKTLRVTAAAPGSHAAEGVPASFRTRGTVAFLTQDYLGLLVHQAAITLLPIIVIAAVGSADSAFFYVPFTMAMTLDVLFLNAASALLAEGARGERSIHALTRMAARRFLGLFVPAAVVAALAAPLVLAPFGDDYAQNGAHVLRLLLLASGCRAVIFLFFAVARVQRRGGPILAVQGALFLMSTGSAVVLAGPLGAEGVAFAWLVTNGVLASAASVYLLRVIRDRDEPRPALGITGDRLGEAR
jgi:O-antigen/teichoic acid export membrane protein